MVKLRCKTVLLGNPSVGKTSIVKKLIDVSDFPLQYSVTKGVSLETTTIQVKEIKDEAQGEDPTKIDPFEGPTSTNKTSEETFAEKETPKMDLGANDADEVEHLIFDLGGLDIYKQDIKNYMTNLNAYVLVYDVTNADSFMNIAKWLDVVNSALGRSDDQVVTRSKANEPFGILIANKVDAKSMTKISRQQGESFAAKHHLTFFETSAATLSVDEPFQFISQHLFKLYREQVDQVQYLCENKLW